MGEEATRNTYVVASSKKYCRTCEEYSSAAFVCSDCHRAKLQEARKRHQLVKKNRDQAALVYQDLLSHQAGELSVVLECEHLEREILEMERKLERARDLTKTAARSKEAWSNAQQQRREELESAELRLASGTAFRQTRTLPTIDLLELTTQALQRQVLLERRRKMQHLAMLFPVCLPNSIAGLDWTKTEDSLLAFDLAGRTILMASYYLKVPLLHRLTYSGGDVWIRARSGEILKITPHVPGMCRALAENARTLAEQQFVPAAELSSSDFILNLYKLLECFKD